MGSVIAVAILLTLLAAGVWFQYRLSRGRMWTPLWLAFSATAAALLFTVAGTIGYDLSRHSRFVAGTPWSSGVILWETGVGLGFAAVSIVLWRLALRSPGLREP